MERKKNNNIKGITYLTYIVQCVTIAAVLERDHPNTLTLQSIQVLITTAILTYTHIGDALEPTQV